MSISRVFDISRRSLAAYQRSLDITTHNIANASNPDYSRQRVELVSDIPERVNGFLWGTGVKIADISRARDTLLDRQIINYNQKFSDQEKQSAILSQVEQVFAEPGEQGLSGVLDQFFNSWHELSATPNSIPLRNSVINAAQNVSNKIQDLNSSLDIVRSDTVNDFRTQVENINELLKNIQSYNAQIFEAKSVGENPNDLMDQRDKAVDDLSKIVNISVSLDKNNVANVSIGGVFAADASYAVEFDYQIENDKIALITAKDKKTPKISGGEINALTVIYNTTIPSYLDQINTIANKLVDSVNSIHQTGYTLTDPLRSGVKFFEGYENGKLKINEEILRDPRLIAASADGTYGNSDIAVKLGELSDAKVVDGLSFSEKYASLISNVGKDKVTVDSTMNANKMVLDQLQSQKSSFSGVSVDEEMTNILTFQRAYQASAKVITVADEMIQTLLNMV
jgi:flagellar hook-associated protein 1 FlgK